MSSNAPLPSVLYETMFPAELEERLRDCPILYIPLGSLEWHSAHLPFGVDSMKAQAICEQVAIRFGGIVAPAIPWGGMHGSWRLGTHPGLSSETRVAFYREVFEGFFEVGFRVFVVVSGHWTSKQTQSARQALNELKMTRPIASVVTFDGADPYDGFDDHPDLAMDHAGERETSIFLHLFPDLVKLDRLSAFDLSDLPGEECHLTNSGIQGRDPVEHATAEKGQRHMERIVRLIGERAVEALAVWKRT